VRFQELGGTLNVSRRCLEGEARFHDAEAHLDEGL
jgi:hypothetical protein